MKISKRQKNKDRGKQASQRLFKNHQKSASRRTKLLFAPLLLFGVLIFLRLFQIQIWDHKTFAAMAQSQYVFQLSVKANRGLISDRNATELALNKPSFDIGVVSSQVKDPVVTSKTLATVLRQNQNRLRREITGKKSHVLIARGIDPKRAQAIISMKLPEVTISEKGERIYPFGEKLGPVLGFVDVDGDGISGVELEFNQLLEGVDAKTVVGLDAKGNPVRLVSHGDQVTKGKNIFLTIDNIIQTIAEEEIARAMREYHAKAGSVVITNPATGEILAMATVPGYDPNQANRFPKATHRIRTITDMYEPGSTFKLVTLAAMLAEDSFQLSDVIFCENGAFKLHGEVIHDTEKHGNLTAEDIFVKSSNIGATKVAAKVGADNMYLWARRFGFGNATGLTLPGEASGILRNPRLWSKFSLAAISFGHEVAVTPLQMAMAYGAVANGGKLMKPQICKEIRTADGELVERFTPQVIRQVMDPETAATMTSIFEKAVREGTGVAAQIGNLKIAGKTGTAQKPRVDQRGYSKSSYVASFCGYYPADEARLLIHVTVDEPNPQYYGGKVAAPTFRNILARILTIQNELEIEYEKEVVPEPTRNEWRKLTDAHKANLTQDMIGKSANTAQEILNSLGVEAQVIGSGDMVEKLEFKRSTNEKDIATLYLALKSYPSDADIVVVPDLSGLSLRRAISELASRRLRPQVKGSGWVVKQEPAAGTERKAGTVCLIECEATESIFSVDQRHADKFARNSVN